MAKENRKNLREKIVAALDEMTSEASNRESIVTIRGHGDCSPPPVCWRQPMDWMWPGPNPTAAEIEHAVSEGPLRLNPRVMDSPR
jgi:hypothetical protein